MIGGVAQLMVAITSGGLWLSYYTYDARVSSIFATRGRVGGHTCPKARPVQLVNLQGTHDGLNPGSFPVKDPID